MRGYTTLEQNVKKTLKLKSANFTALQMCDNGPSRPGAVQRRPSSVGLPVPRAHVHRQLTTLRRLRRACLRPHRPALRSLVYAACRRRCHDDRRTCSSPTSRDSSHAARRRDGSRRRPIRCRGVASMRQEGAIASSCFGGP